MTAEVVQLHRPAKQKHAYTDDFESVIWTYRLRKGDSKWAAFQEYQKALKIASRDRILAGLKAWHAHHKREPEWAPQLRKFFYQRQWEGYEDDAPVAVPVVEVEIKPLMWDGLSKELRDFWHIKSEQLLEADRGAYKAYYSHLYLTGKTGSGRLHFKAPDAYRATRVRADSTFARIIGQPFEVSS